MAHGRWYATAITLSDGRVMVFSGTTETGTTNRAVEIYTEGVGWSPEYIAPWTPPLYPRLHLLPDGECFIQAHGRLRDTLIFPPRLGRLVQACTNLIAHTVILFYCRFCQRTITFLV